MTIEEFMKNVTKAGDMDDTDAAAQAMSDLSDWYKNTEAANKAANDKYKTEHELRGKLALRIADGNLQKSELLTDEQKEQKKVDEAEKHIRETFKFN